MGLHHRFGHFKHKLWPKERSGVKLVVWLPTTKSQDFPQFPYMQVACNIPLKSSWQGLQFWFRPHFNRRFSHKVMGPQSCGRPNFGNLRTPIWKSRDKMTFGCWYHIYYKGGGDGFSQVRAVVSFVNPSLLVVRPCTKVFQLLTNQIIVWFV
jgi:hypothetical protein